MNSISSLHPSTSSLTRIVVIQRPNRGWIRRECGRGLSAPTVAAKSLARPREVGALRPLPHSKRAKVGRHLQSQLTRTAALALCLATGTVAAFAADAPAASEIQLIVSQAADGEIAGWRSFHEKAGTKTAEVWRLQSAGVLVCAGVPRGYLYTERDYADFELRFEWRYPRGAAKSNGGVLVRMTGEHCIWPKCLELQLNMGQAGDFWGLRGYALSGPAEPMKTMEHKLFGTCRNLKRLADLEKPIGEWNQHEAVVEGGTVTQKLNGTLVNRATGCETAAGKILITAEGQEIHFRNIRLIPRKSGS
ncbi:MAG: DUF1080 domain-containing protein [Verrucomicrobiia bacterium]